MKKFLSNVLFGACLLVYMVGQRIYETIRDIFKVIKNAFRPLSIL